MDSGLALRAPRNDGLRDDVRSQLVFDKGDAVAQMQLALLQALHLDDVRAGRLLQCRNRGVEITMLLLKARQVRPKLVFFFLRHCRLGRALARSYAGSRSAGKWLWIIAFRPMPDKPARPPAGSMHSGDFQPYTKALYLPVGERV